MKRIILFLTILTSLLFAACGGATETNTNSANKTNASNTSVSNAKQDPLAAQTPVPAAATNDAPTLTPVYKAYCAAWVKKDEAALRKIYSSDTIKDFERQMKEDGIKTLAEFLSDDQASNELCEARNEKISGDTATAEVRTKGYPSGITVVFVKEAGEWKLTNKRPEGALK